MIMKLIINIEANNKFLLSDCIQAKLCTFVWLLIASEVSMVSIWK